MIEKDNQEEEEDQILQEDLMESMKMVSKKSNWMNKEEVAEEAALDPVVPVVGRGRQRAAPHVARDKDVLLVVEVQLLEQVVGAHGAQADRKALGARCASRRPTQASTSWSNAARKRCLSWLIAWSTKSFHSASPRTGRMKLATRERSGAGPTSAARRGGAPCYGSLRACTSRA